MSRNLVLIILLIVFTVILLPAAVVSVGRGENRSLTEGKEENKSKTAGEDDLAADSAVKIRLLRADLGRVVQIELEEYLVGVVAAEMPASFDLEALKAQAVVARTYTLHRSRLYGGGGCSRSAEPADICSDSAHCQAWVDPLTAFQELPPQRAAEYLNRIRQAVKETSGEVIRHGGRLIEAVYHSTCGGQTEASEALWSGNSVPYLQSVACPFCQHSPHYRGEKLISHQDFAAAFEERLALPVTGFAGLPLEVIEKTPGGRIGLLSVGGLTLEGSEMRRLLDLPSTAFTLSWNSGGLLVMSRGNGHGVGFCQYGADGAASQGLDYRQIIEHYYPGAELSRFD